MAGRTEPGGLSRLLAACLALALGGCGKSTAEWVEQLRAKDSALRLRAVKALGERGGEVEVVVPALAGALKDSDPFVRRDAARALGKLGARARPAAPALVAALRDRSPAVRKAAAEALGKVDPSGR